jgi:hypothetical protein
VGARDGFEVVFLDGGGDGVRVEGHSTAVEDGEAWAVQYEIVADAGWAARRAHVRGRSAAGSREVTLEADGAGRWRVDGAPAAHLDGCLDVDLEASALTNAFPVHRLALEVGQTAQAPAVYVRALDLAVERLEQRYGRLADDDRRRYAYAAPAFAYEGELVYDEHGLVLAYPGLAVRVV